MNQETKLKLLAALQKVIAAKAVSEMQQTEENAQQMIEWMDQEQVTRHEQEIKHRQYQMLWVANVIIALLAVIMEMILSSYTSYLGAVFITPTPIVLIAAAVTAVLWVVMAIPTIIMNIIHKVQWWQWVISVLFGLTSVLNACNAYYMIIKLQHVYDIIQALHPFLGL